MIFDFLKHSCKHEKVSAEVNEAYCPDCGALIQNKWFLVRCSCCNIKRTSHLKAQTIIPDAKFCNNCGASEYYIQELQSPNFTDIRYAVFKKIVINDNSKDIYTRQIWIDEEQYSSNNYLATKTIPMLQKP